MALTVRFKFKGRCLYHPRYNPAKDGLGGIKGGCPTCQQLHRVWAFTEHANSAARYFDGERGLPGRSFAWYRRVVAR